VSSHPAKTPHLGAASEEVGAAAFILQGITLRYVNQAAEAITGYSRAEILAMPFWELVHPDDRDLVRERALARQRGESVPWHYEVRVRRKDGSIRPAEFTLGIIEYEGKPAVLGTAVDLTAQKAAAEQLRASERRFRALTENGSDIVLLADAQGGIRYLGASVERILGFSPEWLIGKDGLARMHADDRERVTAVYRKLSEEPGSRASAVYRVQHRDGSWRWLESIGHNLLDDPAVGGIIVNSRDVTDREEALAGYRALVEHSLQGLVIIQDGRVVFANPGVTDVTGYTQEELLAFGTEEQRAMIHATDAPAVWEKWQRRLRGDAHSPRTEFRLVRKDGTVRWLETYASDTEYRGRPAVQVAYVDISDRKEAEEAARRHQQELAHVLRRRTLGEMAAVIAHEVTQPLTAIANYAKGCAHRLRTNNTTPEQLLGALDEIAAQAVRAGEIIRRLRGFVRRGEPKRTTTHLNELVEEVIRFISAEAHERNVHLSVELAADLPPLLLDVVQIEQVVLNLLRNAFDAVTDEQAGGGQLVIRTGRDGGDAVVSVRDTGPGLHPDVAGEIFEPFVTSKPGGLGMGLSICRSIVDAHGGRLWATPNDPHRGMTFAFTLPLAPDREG
jgi:PAS domain S-box-containing protein